jgi:putative transposase
MTELEGIRTGRRCVFALHAHLVFVTKFRHRVFGDRHLARMEEIMRAVCADFETELVEFNGENNHVHLLVNFPPKAAPAKLVNNLKGVSSRRLRQEFPDSCGTTTGPTSSGRARTSRAPPAGHR